MPFFNLAKRLFNKLSSFLSLLIFSLTPYLANAQDNGTVNILTWWGYLDYPELVQLVEKKCHVKLSYDKYYTNAEFTRRLNYQGQNYDVLIFSDTIYNAVKQGIARNNSDLYKLSRHYHPIIRQHYLKNKLPSNIVYFIHSLTGFLWNPLQVKLDESDTIYSMFSKAGDNTVVIIDDPVEAAKLVSLGLSNGKNKLVPTELTENYLTKANFLHIVGKSRVYITNDYSQIYLKPDFAFSYTWSGEAMVDLQKSGKDYEFLIHPKLSYISSDLLAVLNDKPNAICVAKVLGSREFARKLQNKDFYFSPYTDTSEIDNKAFKKVYQEFIIELPRLSWIKPVDNEEFERLSTTWKLIKLNFNH
jgi:hypothetical protein